MISATYSYAPGVIFAWDEFTGATSTLNTRTAAAGGTWATSGATTDFTQTGPILGNPSVESRTTALTEAGPRFALLGTTSSTSIEINVDAAAFSFSAASEKKLFAIARWVDASNYAFAEIDITNVAGQFEVAFRTGVVVATVRSVLATSLLTIPSNGFWLQTRLIIYPSGRMLAWLFQPSGGTLAYLDSTSSVLATGGTLATGKSGFADQSINTGSGSRYYGSFYASVPNAEPTVINSGESLEIRSDANLRQSADGTTYGEIVGRGSRLFVPQAGDQNRTTRIAVRAVGNDVTTMADTPLGGTLTAQVFVTPRYVAAPR